MKKSTQKKMAKAITSLILGKPKKKKSAPPKPKENIRPAFKVTIKKEIVEDSPDDRKPFAPDRLEIEGFSCPGGGFCSWAKYIVKGQNIETGKSSTDHVIASNSVDAMCMIEAKGIMKPECATVISHDPPTERQLEFAEELKIKIPAGINKRDMSAIITRAEKWDDYIHTPIYTTELPTVEFAKYALRRGYIFSFYDCEPELVECALNDSEKKFAIAFYAYRIICDKTGQPIKDMETDADYEKYMLFANNILSDESLEKSFDNNKYDNGNGHIKVYKVFQSFFEYK